MAQYSRQVNLDTETMEDRSLSPTCEVLGDEARTVFVSPSLTYRVRYTSLWKGRSGLEKLLMVVVAFLLLFSCSCLIVLLVTKQVILTLESTFEMSRENCGYSSLESIFNI